MEPAAQAGPKTAVAPLGKLNIVKPEETKKAKAIPVARADDNYQFPPLSLLREPVTVDASASEEEHRQNAENLLRILGEFNVEVTLGEIHVGPVITRYEVVPAAGVRVEKIAGLDKNIALGMRAQSVRIMAPIPGKAAVGVEVPNQKATQVGLREILESEDWASAKADLPIALGKDVSGKPLVSDLAKMPHLLIAGATGSGKSVCINAIISSILYHASPRDVRLLMVDPEDRRAEDLQRPAAHADSGGDRGEEGARRAQMAAEGDGEAIPDFRPGRRAQHQRLQQPEEDRETRRSACGGPGHARRRPPPAGRSRSPTTCITSSRSSTSWPT